MAKGLAAMVKSANTKAAVAYETAGIVPVNTKPIKLDPQQMAAVKSEANKIIVVAGAGSGKTRVLTERVRDLIENGVDPSTIVCITYTNAAAQEMKERLANVQNIGDVFIGTIHSFANKVYANSGNNYTIMNDDVSLDLHREVLKPEKGYLHLSFDRYLKYLDMEQAYTLGKVEEVEVQRFLMPSERDDLKRASAEIREICKRRNIIGFDKLLQLAKEYYASIGGNIAHLLCDEYQDVGPLEDKFVTELAADNEFLIGDDWQAIYGFKGSNVEIFKAKIKNPKYTVFKLEHNYRNSEAVTRIAKQVIAQVGDKIEKNVILKAGREGEVIVKTKAQLPIILMGIKDKGDFKDWFILARTNKQVAEIAEQLDRLGIPYVGFKRAGMSFESLKEQVGQNAVKLLTVHVSKGLESKNVLLYGNFPIRQPGYMQDEEERRVMYVGITRAEENLIILN